MTKTTQVILVACMMLLMHFAVAQTCNDDIMESAPEQRFIVRADEVIDTQTRLIWQRCALGQTGSNCTGGAAILLTWQDVLQAAQTLRDTTGDGWRVPNIRELESLVENRCFDPAINLAVFPNTKSSDYVSASPMLFTSRETAAFGLDFKDGYAGELSKSLGRYVRLVRDGQTR